MQLVLVLIAKSGNLILRNHTLRNLFCNISHDLTSQGYISLSEPIYEPNYNILLGIC